MMKRIAIAIAILMPLAAQAAKAPTPPPNHAAQLTEPAAPAAPHAPEALLEPTQVIARLLQIFSDPIIARSIPLYASDVAPLLDALNACAKVQIPNAQGAIVSHGECPAVTAALAPKLSTP